VDVDQLGVWVINLDHSTGRLDSMRRQLDALGLAWHRVAAIHGDRLTDAQRALFDTEGYRRKHGKTVNWRELGCYLSHLEAMKALLASSHEFGLVLEDDVVVGADTPAVLDALGAQVDAWDVVKLSGIHSGSPRPVRTLGAGRDLCVMLSRCTGASAYVVNRRAAQVYLDKLLPMQLPYDHAQDRGWALGLKVRKVHPVVCTHSYDQGSTIDVAPPKGHRTQAARLPWYRRLSVYRYRLGNELSRLAHGLFTWWRERASARAG